MLRIYFPFLFLLLGSIGYAKEPLALKSAFVVLKYGTVELEAKNGSTREVSNASESEGGAPKFVRFAEGETVRMKENSDGSLMIPDVGMAVLKPDTKVRLPIHEGVEEKGVASMELLGGKLYLDVDSSKLAKKDKEFRLKTPTTILAVKGTQFFVDIGKDYETAGVHEGNVQMVEQESGKSVNIARGFAAMAKPGAVTKARRLTNEEQALSKVYGGAAFKLVPAEKARRVYQVAGERAELKLGEETNSGRAIKASFQPWDHWNDIGGMIALDLPGRCPSEPLGVFFAVKLQGIEKFNPTAEITWKKVDLTLSKRAWVGLPEGEKLGEWVYYYVPFNKTPAPADKPESAKMTFFVDVRASKNPDPNPNEPAPKGESKWSIEVGPVFYLVDAGEE